MGWFLYGLVVGAVTLRLVIWAQAGDIVAAWYAWPLLGITVILGALTAQHFLASHREMEPRAAWLGLLFMGVPTLIITAALIWMFSST